MLERLRASGASAPAMGADTYAKTGEDEGRGLRVAERLARSPGWGPGVHGRILVKTKEGIKGNLRSGPRVSSEWREFHGAGDTQSGHENLANSAVA